MLINGVPFADFQRIVANVSANNYENNLIVHRDSTDLHGVRAPRIRARLGVVSTGSREGLPADQTLPGVRRSASAYSNNRRVAAACWHTYRDALTALFDEYPNAIVRTALATYHGKDGFEDSYPATANINIGSMVSPVYADEACDCEGK